MDGDVPLDMALIHYHPPIHPRDWPATRKRSVAAVACISTAMIGALIGMYTGLGHSISQFIQGPAINNSEYFGTLIFYLGLAIPTFFFWPLPLLHGRRPYILASLALAIPLLKVGLCYTMCLLGWRRGWMLMTLLLCVDVRDVDCRVRMGCVGRPSLFPVTDEVFQVLYCRHYDVDMWEGRRSR